MHERRDIEGGLRVVLVLAALVSSGCKPTPLPGEPNAPAAVLASVEARGADEDFDLEDPILVEIAGRALTLSEFDQRASALSRTAQLRLNTPETRGSLLEMFIWLELLARQAEAEGLAGMPREDLMVDDAVARATLDALGARTVSRGDVSDADVAREYTERADEFQRPMMVPVHTIVVATEAEAETLRARIEIALRHAEAADVYRVLAARHSVVPELADAGGFVGRMTPVGDGDDVDPAFAAAVFGDHRTPLRPVVQTTRGWEVVHVGQVLEGLNVSLEAATPFLRDELHRRRLAATQRSALDSRRTELGVAIDRAALERLASARASVGGEAHSLRPRRYSVEALARSPLSELGDPEAERIVAEFAELGRTPLAARVDERAATDDSVPAAPDAPATE